MATFGEILHELRRDKRLSQKQLAQILYVTTGTVSNYENDHHLPDVDKLILLADYFGVTTDFCLVEQVPIYHQTYLKKTLFLEKRLAAFCLISDLFPQIDNK